MIRLREYLADPEVFLAAEVQRLRPCLRILFHVIFFATDGAGRFNADAALLRTVLYTAVQQQVSIRDVQAWLCDLHVGGFIKLYTEKDAALGKVTGKYWRQRDVKRKVIHPDDRPDPPGETEDLFTNVPFLTELNRREGKGKTAAPRMPFGMSAAAAMSGSSIPRETNAEWLARLARDWPMIDIAAQLAKANRKRRGDVERGWFESVWLPGVSPLAPTTIIGAKSSDSEPPGWRAWLETMYPGNTINAENRPWASVPAEIREKLQVDRRKIS